MRHASLRCLALLAAIVAVLSACDGDEVSDTPTETRPAATEAAAATFPPEATATPLPPLPPAAAISVPDGFAPEVFATGLDQPTALAWGPDGELYATENTGAVVRVSRGTDAPEDVAAGFEVPLGLTWVDDTLYVTSMGRLDALEFINDESPSRRTVVEGLPFGLHQQNNVVLGADGRLYFGSGSTCNDCDEADERSAAVLSVNTDGSDPRVVARGMRNPFGLAFHPVSGDLYASVNGTDYLDQPGDPEPADTIVRIRDGAHYGWPGCDASARELRLVGDCPGAEPPAAYMAPHSSPDGMAFYTGPSFPAEYANNLFVCEWGEYVETTGNGPRLMRVVLIPDGTAPIENVSVFATGFEHPLAVIVDEYGALLVADWGTGVIYRIQALGSP